VIDRAGPYAVLRLVGELDVASAPTVRAGVAKCLAHQPTAVIGELGGVRIRDASALAVFDAAAREVSQRRGVRVVLCAPNPDVAAALRSSPVLRYVRFFPNLEAAMAGLENDTAPGQLSARLQPVVGAARQARELVTEACARWDVPELIGPACTIVTELVNNVVVHARTPMEVVLRIGERYLHISVRDESAQAPEARGPASPTAPGGRGLMMVAAVAQRWGFTPAGAGKVVWATLRTDEAAAH
jgi:anti-anti-sigma factor